MVVLTKFTRATLGSYLCYLVQGWWGKYSTVYCILVVPGVIQKKMPMHIAFEEHVQFRSQWHLHKHITIVNDASRKVSEGCHITLASSIMILLASFTFMYNFYSVSITYDCQLMIVN